MAFEKAVPTATLSLQSSLTLSWLHFLTTSTYTTHPTPQQDMPAQQHVA
jgi:hypothetical protein